MKCVIDTSSVHGVDSFVIGMPHRWVLLGFHDKHKLWREITRSSATVKGYAMKFQITADLKAKIYNKTMPL